MKEARRLIIIGSGPAGYTAALYVARSNLEPLVFAGDQPGGQMMLTTEVENYPGFPDGVLGPDLMELMRKQAERFGAQILFQSVTAVDFSSRPFKVFAGADEYTADAVIIATGASAKWLGLESEARLRGRGVSACATCDAPFFRGKDVVVVGGGDTAMEDALFLTKFAKSVTVIHRRDRLRASKVMQEQAFSNPKIRFLWNSVVEEIIGDKVVEGIAIKNVRTEQVTQLACQGVFIAIGHEPNTQIFKGQLALDGKGYILTKDHTRTSVEGVFAAGDVHDPRYRQAVTAAAFGCMAAMDAEKLLDEKARPVQTVASAPPLG